jgi:hypothetical protein
VYLASRTPLGAVVHAADPQAATWSWREVRRIERDTLAATSEGAVVAFRSMGQADPRAVVTRERLVIYTPDPEWLSSMDLRTGAWEQNKTESRVIRLRGASDYGKSWFEVDKYLSTTLPVFTSKTEAYVLASPFTSWKGAPALYKTVDAGKTWKIAGALPPNMDRFWGGVLIFDPSVRRLGYQTPAGAVTWTRDDGASWR